MVNSKAQLPSVTGKVLLRRSKMKLGYLDEKPEVWGLHMLRGGVIDNDDIVAYASQAANVPADNVNLALQALLDAITYFVINGHTVQIPGLGSIGTITNVKVAQTLEEANADTIRKTHIQFYPTDQVRELCSLKNVSTELVKLEVPGTSTGGGDNEPAEPDPGQDTGD
ncbi:MAG: hypothetical protein IJV33_07120 [Bacteroidaceae bacterium]|nr:hypothetical protein [Bacteroidaceae bacterium]